MTLHDVLATKPNLLLDFDGPMCSVFSTITSADATRELTAALVSNGVAVPDKIRETHDPFMLLYHVAAVAPEYSELAQVALVDLERAAVQSAQPTHGLRLMLETLLSTGHTVAVVSNNSQAAVADFITAQGLQPFISGVSARESPDPALLKPNPHLLRQAAHNLGLQLNSCVLLGDSVTDIQASRRAGTAAIAFANKPGKQQVLAATNPDALITSLSQVTEALASQVPRKQDQGD